MTDTTLAPQQNPLDWLNNARQNIPDAQSAALSWPLQKMVSVAIQAAAGSNTHTARAYFRGIGNFLVFLGDQVRSLLPQDWYPLAVQTVVEGERPQYTRAAWEFRGYAGILQLVTPTMLDAFYNHCVAHGDSPNTARLRFDAARVFLSVALREGVLTTAQGQRLGLKPYHKRRKRDEQPVGRRLKPAEVHKLQRAVEEHAKQPSKRLRDRAILDLMLYAGLRREEVAGLPLSALKQDGGRWWIVLQGKGRKTRRLKVHDALYKTLFTYLAWTGGQPGENNPVFGGMTKGGNLTGKPLMPSTIGRLVAEYGYLAGLAPRTGRNRLSPHDLRRTCSRNAYDNGANLLLVQAMLGHQDPKTTARYIGAYEEDDHMAVDYIKY